jgi:lysyl-tRNA synthetase class I
MQTLPAMRTNRNSFGLFGGDLANFNLYLGEYKMQKTEVNSAVAEMLFIGGRAIDEVEASIKEIGFASQKEIAKISKSQDELNRLNANLLGWIAQLDADGKVMRYADDHELTPKKIIPIPYDEFMVIRGFYVGAAYDAGAVSIEAAEKVWESAIKELASEAGYTRPKADNKDAVRMAEKRAKLVEKYAPKSTGELIEEKQALLAKGDNKSLSLVKEINDEVKRREKPELDEQQKARVATRDKIIARARELCKAGTADADEKLISALLALG